MRSSDVVKTRQDLRRLVWSERANTSGTAGCFLKARETTGAETWYYKLSCYDSYRGIYGHECANEVVASRLMGLLGVPHLEYQLVHALVSIDGVEHDTWLNRSRSFRQQGERKVAFDTFYDMEKKSGESPLELADRFGWGEAIQRMMIVDYLIANRDRHGANIEVLRDRQGVVRLAPFFDSGLSFACFCYGDTERVQAFDPLSDVNANNYLGTRSLEENIRRFVDARTVAQLAQPLSPEHRMVLFRGLEGALPQGHRDKMWDIMWERWCRLENLCHS